MALHLCAGLFQSANITNRHSFARFSGTVYLNVSTVHIYIYIYICIYYVYLYTRICSVKMPGPGGRAGAGPVPDRGDLKASIMIIITTTMIVSTIIIIIIIIVIFTFPTEIIIYTWDARRRTIFSADSPCLISLSLSLYLSTFPESSSGFVNPWDSGCSVPQPGRSENARSGTSSKKQVFGYLFEPGGAWAWEKSRTRAETEQHGGSCRRRRYVQDRACDLCRLRFAWGTPPALAPRWLPLWTPTRSWACPTWRTSRPAAQAYNIICYTIQQYNIT